MNDVGQYCSVPVQISYLSHNIFETNAIYRIILFINISI